MPPFPAHVENGRISLGHDLNRERVRLWCKENEGARLEISAMLPESKKQRRFYHGAVIPLWSYLDGKDYRDSQVLADLHELAKLEFNGAIIVVGGKTRKVGRSTKGALRDGYLERVIEYLEENYGIKRQEFLDPKDYKYFRDAVYMTGEYDCYIDYLIGKGVFKNKKDV